MMIILISVVVGVVVVVVVVVPTVNDSQIHGGTFFEMYVKE